MNIMVLDDHIAIGEGTKVILQEEMDCKAEVFTDPFIALKKIKEETYDIYLIDFNLPRMNGIQFIKRLLEIQPSAIAIIYTGYNMEEHYLDLLEIGFFGFVSKAESKKQLIDTIHYALQGKTIISISLLNRLNIHKNNSRKPINLTKRERQILDLVRNGMTNKAIALELYLSQRTIEKELTSIFSKLGVESRAEAAIKWNELAIKKK